jgi:hypothetical protein
MNGKLFSGYCAQIELEDVERLRTYRKTPGAENTRRGSSNANLEPCHQMIPGTLSVSNSFG